MKHAELSFVRSFLYTPGDNPHLITKAIASRADAVIIDLEDSVIPERKAEGRETIEGTLAGFDNTGCEIWIRVNAKPELLRKDILLVNRIRPDGIVIPKAEDLDELVKLVDDLATDIRVQILIESARGVRSVPALLSAPRVERLQIGELDLAADLGMSLEAREELWPMRLDVVVASAAAGKEPPVGSVAVDFRDLVTYERETLRFRNMGYGSRAAIHPAQVDVINRVFTPTSEEIEWAQSLLAAAADAEQRGTGVLVDAQGRMVDEAVLRSARRLLGRQRDLL